MAGHKDMGGKPEFKEKFGKSGGANFGKGGKNNKGGKHARKEKTGKKY